MQAATKLGPLSIRSGETLRSLTRGFSPKASKAFTGVAYIDDLIDQARVHRDRLYEAADELLEVHGDPQSPLATLAATRVHQVVANYIYDFCAGRENIGPVTTALENDLVFQVDGAETSNITPSSRTTDHSTFIPEQLAREIGVDQKLAEIIVSCVKKSNQSVTPDDVANAALKIQGLGLNLNLIEAVFYLTTIDKPISFSAAAQALENIKTRRVMDGTRERSINQDFVVDVIYGLTKPYNQKHLNPSYIYDARGSKLFEDIMRLPEYSKIATGLEARIFRDRRHEIAQLIQSQFGDSPFVLFDAGTGNARKTEMLVDELLKPEYNLRFIFMPNDIDATIVEEVRARLANNYPQLKVLPMVGDYFESFKSLEDISSRKVAMFIGGTMGNLPVEQRVKFLEGLRASLNPGDLFILGMHTKNLSFDSLQHAYYDIGLDLENPLPRHLGVTAQFDTNLFHRMEYELGANFGPLGLDNLRYYSSYNPYTGINSTFTSGNAQIIRFELLGGLEVNLEETETIFVESSDRFGPQDINNLVTRTGFEILSSYYSSGSPEDRYCGLFVMQAV